MSELKFRLALDSGAFVTGMISAGAQVDRFSGHSDRAAVAAERLGANVARVGHYAAGLVALNQVGQSTGQLIRLADEYANMAGRLNLVSDSTAEAAAAQGRLFDLAQQTRTGVSSLSDVYVKLRQSTDGTGISQERLLAITSTIGKTMTLSGSSAESMNAALMQLGQGMSSGVLRGEELNSILEQAPALAQAIATGMGTTVGALRKLGEEGKLTSEVVVNALEQSAKKVDSDFSKLPLTVGQAMTQVQNSLLQAVGVFDQTNGLSSGLASGISTLAQNMGALVSVATVLAGVVGGRMVASIYAGTTAVLADRAARIASLQSTVAQTEAVAIHTGFILADARATLASASGFGASVVAQNAVVAATQRHTAALAAQSAAQAAVASTSAAATLGARALGLLGGPIGLVTTALSLGVAAWQLWGDSSKAAESAATGNVERSTADIVASLDKQIAKLQERNRLAAAGAAGIAKGGGEGAEELARLQKKIDDFTAGKGEAAGVNDAARQAILQTTVQQYAALYSRMQQVGDEQKKLDALGQQSKLSVYMEKYATDTEKLQAELKKVREELGGTIPPDLEARIRAKFTKPAKEVVDEMAKYRNLVADLAGDQAGYSSSFNEQLATLTTGWQRGGTSLQGYRDQVAQLVAKQPFAVELAREAAAAAKAETDATEKLTRVRADARTREDEGIAAYLEAQQTASTAALQTVNTAVKALEDEAAAATLAARQNITLAEAVEEVTLARLREQQAKYIEGSEPYLAVEREIQARQRLLTQIRAKQDRENDTNARKAGDELRRREEAEWAQTWQQVGQSFADNLMQGGKSAGQYIRDLFRTMVLRPLLSPVVGGVAGMLGLPGTASAAGGAGGLNLGSLSQLASLGSAFKSGSALALSGAGGTGLALEGAGAMLQSGQYAAGLSQGAGALAPWAAGAMAGGVLGRGIGNGYGIGGKSSNGVVNVGTVAGAVLGGPIGAAIGGAIGGLVNRAFGRKTTEQGIEGTLGGDAGFVGSAYEFQKGGWFTSNRTNRSALDAGTTSAFTDAVGTMRTQTREYAAALGLGSASVGAYTQAIKLNLKGLSEQQQTEAINKALAGFADGLASSLGADLASVAQRGETAAQTLARVGSALVQVNRTFDLLGRAALSADLRGGDLASQLVTDAGGAQQLDALVSSYFGQFYTAGERQAAQLGQLGDAVSALGLTLPTTREAFRQLVDAQDVTTESGRRNYLALLNLSGAFAEAVPAIEGTTAALRTASDVANERKRLETELARATGDTAALRAAELAGIDPSNQALQQRIYALEDERRAADALAGAGQGVVDFLAELRGAANVGSAAGLRSAYAADLAAAQVGDADASRRVVSSARALLSSVRESATGPIELARESARIAAQLEALPATTAAAAANAAKASTAFGAAPAAPGGVADAGAAPPPAAAPAVAPVPLAPALPVQTSATADPAVVKALAALQAELAALRAEQSAQALQIVAHTARTARILGDVSASGNAFTTVPG